MVIRPEGSSDRAAVRQVNEAAFGGPEEAALVDALRDSPLALLSLVAEVDGAVVGHILFSRMWIDAAAGSIDAVALAPMAVLPGQQRRRIGSRLVRHGLERLRDAGERIVIVVGHAEYYPRLGFSSERAGALESPFPREHFMALELVAGALDNVRGRVRYPEPFGI